MKMKQKKNNSKVESRQISNLRSFLQIFQHFANSKCERDALKFIYDNTCFQHLNPGDKLHRTSSSYNGSIIIVTRGILNAYIDDDQPAQRNIWIGIPNSVFIQSSQSVPDGENITIEAVLTSSMMILPYHVMEKSCERYPSISVIFNQFLYPKAIKSLNDFTLLQRITRPNLRFGLFIKCFPGLYKLLPIQLRYAYTGTLEAPEC